MEVSLISTETIRPSSLPLDLHLKPYKLCLFDQIAHFTYAPIILFYSGTGQPGVDHIPETLAQLKKSLSETLALFYPFSGRPINNLYVDNFEAGAPFVEARVSCSLAEYFKLRQNELLNEFVPFPPFCRETDNSKPQIGFQINLFACGGIAIGTSLGHKIGDGGTLSHFLTSWATVFRGDADKIVKPNLTDASVVFPPREDLPQHFRTLTSQQWFRRGEFVTRRFAFDTNAVATLRDTASSERVPKPSRNEALTSFIWKHAAAASQAAKGDPKPRASVIVHATNMRTRMKSQALNFAIGNLFWWAKAASDNAAKAELPELVGILKESFVNFNAEYLEGDVGFAAVSKFLDIMGGIFAADPEVAPELYHFSNWNGFFNEVDFGWGKPVWVGAHGKAGSEFGNTVIFVDGQGGNKGIEAFLTLEEKHMAVLEKDPKFLAFATPDEVPTLIVKY